MRLKLCQLAVYLWRCCESWTVIAESHITMFRIFIARGPRGVAFVVHLSVCVHHCWLCNQTVGCVWCLFFFIFLVFGERWESFVCLMQTMLLLKIMVETQFHLHTHTHMYTYTYVHMYALNPHPPTPHHSNLPSPPAHHHHYQHSCSTQHAHCFHPTYRMSEIM